MIEFGRQDTSEVSTQGLDKLQVPQNYIATNSFEAEIKLANAILADADRKTIAEAKEIAVIRCTQYLADKLEYSFRGISESTKKALQQIFSTHSDAARKSAETSSETLVDNFETFEAEATLAKSLKDNPGDALELCAQFVAANYDGLQSLHPNAQKILYSMWPLSIQLYDAPLSKLCELELKEVPIGTEVNFVIRKGMSPRMILESIERVHGRGMRERLLQPDSFLSLTNREILDQIFDKDTKFCTTICFALDSPNRELQEVQLESANLKPSEGWVVMLAAALVRDTVGFPRLYIPTERHEFVDKGDLFRGKNVRTQSEIVSSFRGTIICSEYKYNFELYKNSNDLVPAGSPI